MLHRSSRFIVLVLASVLFYSGCQPSLVRYGNRASCYGFYASGGHRRGYSIPATAWYLEMSVAWDENNEAFVVRDKSGWVHTIKYDGEIGAMQTLLTEGTGRALDLASKRNLLAISTGVSDDAIVYVYSLQEGGPEDLVATIPTIQSPNWHPYQLLLAGKYFPEGYDIATNIIGVFDLAGSEPTLVQTYELGNIAISDVFGWSSTGDIIAVTQESAYGTVPYYIYTKDGDVKRSILPKIYNTCVLDGQWSPQEQTIAFSSVNELPIGWDIYIETVPSSKKEDGSVINLTSSPREDEVGAAWSPDGELIAYTKAYEDEAGNLRQEIFVVDINDESYIPVQLTDSLNEYETDPLWLSDTEIAFLSWVPAEGKWTLNIVSIEDPIVSVSTLMDIPEDWYLEPGFLDSQ